MNGLEVRRRARKAARKQRGMTLVEIMVVLVILGLIAGAIVVAVIPRLGEAKQSTARTEIQSIKSALQLYYTKTGKYPDTGVGLKALVDGQYIEKSTDPWGNEYIYLNEGGKPAIISYGRDGQQGGEGEDADIDSRQLNGPANK